MAGRKKIGSQSLIELGRRSGSDLPQSNTGERRLKTSNIVDLDDADPYTFVGSQSLQLQGNRSSSMSKPKQTTLIQYSSSSSSTPASMRNVKITSSKKGETTPVQSNTSNSLHSNSASRSSKNKRSPAALTERERLQLKEKEDLVRALEASIQSSKREERHRRRFGDQSRSPLRNEGSQDLVEGVRGVDSKVTAKVQRKERVGHMTEEKEERMSIEGKVDSVSLKKKEIEIKEGIGRKQEVSSGNRVGGMKPVAMRREGSKIQMKMKRPAEGVKKTMRIGRGSSGLEEDESKVLDVSVKNEISGDKHPSSGKDRRRGISKLILNDSDEETEMHGVDDPEPTAAQRKTHSDEVPMEIDKESPRSEITTANDRVGLSMLAKTIEEESDSEAEYSAVIPSNGISGQALLHPSSDRGSPSDAPVIIVPETEGTMLNDDMEGFNVDSSLSPPPATPSSRSKLKSVTISKLKLKKPSNKVDHKEPTLSPEVVDEKGNATPKLVSESSLLEKESVSRWTGKGKLPAHLVPSGKKHQVARKLEGDKTERRTSSGVAKRDDRSTPPLSSSDACVRSDGSSFPESLSKRKLFPGSPSMMAVGDMQQQLPRGKLPFKKNSSRQVGESAKDKDVTIPLSELEEGGEDASQLDKDTDSVTIGSTSTIGVFETSLVDQSISRGSSHKKVIKKLSLSKSLDKSKTSSLESNVPLPRSRSPLKSQAIADSGSYISESSNTQKEVLGAARTRVLNSLTLKRICNVTSTRPSRNLDEESQSTMSYDPSSKGVATGEVASAAGESTTLRVNRRKRRLSKEPVEAASRKESKLEDVAPLTESPPPVGSSRRSKASVGKFTSKPQRASSSSAVPTGGKCKIYAPPPFYAHGGIAPVEYSKVILDSLNKYISLLADAQSKVWTRVKWGKPIAMAPKNASQISVRKSTKTAQLQEWKYALKLNSNLADDSNVGNLLSPSQGSDEVATSGELCDEDTVLQKDRDIDNENPVIENMDQVIPDEDQVTNREDQVINIKDQVINDEDPIIGNEEVRPEQALSTQDIDSNSSAEDRFIPLVSYHDDSDGKEKSTNIEKVETSPVASVSERSSSILTEIDLRRTSGSSSPTTGQLKPMALSPHLIQKGSSSNDDMKELLPSDTQETFLESHFKDCANERGVRGSASVQDDSTVPITTRNTPNRTASAFKQKKIIRKRLLRELENGGSSEGEGREERQSSPWLNSRSQDSNRCTPRAKRFKTGERSSGKNKKKKSVLGTPGRQKKNRTSAAARLILKKGKSAGTASFVPKPLPESRSGTVGKGRKPTSSLSRLLWSDSDVDTSPECTAPPPRELATSSQVKPVLKRMIEKRLPSCSDSDFNQPAPFAGAAKKSKGNSTIDLTELAEEGPFPGTANERDAAKPRVEESDSEGVVRDLLRCPVCKKMFDRKDLSRHTDECVASPAGKMKNLSKCITCGRMFASSVISVHIEQCGVTSSDEALAPLSRIGKNADTSRLKKVKRTADAISRKRSHVNLLQTALRSSSSEEIDDRESEDGIIEISDDDEGYTRHNYGSRHSSSSSSLVGGTDTVHPNYPRAIPCDDGGFMVENPSNVAIHTFTRLQDMDQKERELYQNQFKKKSSKKQSRYLTGVPSSLRGGGGSKPRKGSGTAKKNRKSKFSKNMWKNNKK